MDDFSAKIENKKRKLENALSELNNEISVSFSFLQCLKNRSAEIVKDLNSVSTPGLYFKRFMEVNSFILKYLSFLNEINCKFEMLGIYEKNDIDSVSVVENNGTSKILGVNDKSDSQSDFHNSLPCLPNNDGITENPVEPNGLINKVKSCNTSGNIKCEVENPKKNSCITSQITNSELRSNIHANLATKADSDANSHSSIEESSIKLKSLKIKQSPNREIETKTPSSHLICVSSAIKETLQNVRGSGAALIDSANTPKEIQQVRTHLPNADIPVAEVMPRKVIDCNSEILKNDISLQETIDNDLKAPSRKSIEESKNEDDIKPMHISRKVGDEYEVLIEHIQSPSEFYVYIKDIQSNLFVELIQNTKMICSIKSKVWDKKNESRKAWLSKQLGSYVLYYSKCDETWCRAKVINWCLNFKDDFIKIFLVDYGEYKCVSIDDLEAMPEYFKKYPACAIRCHLYGICPSDIDIDTDTHSWGKESTEKMKSLTETSKKLKIKIAPEDDFLPKVSLPVTLWLTDKNKECVNELLVESKCAVYCFDSELMNSKPRSELSVENEILKHWNPMKEDFEAYENCYDLNIDDPANYIYGYVGQDYERICKHFAKTGYCFKGQACKKEHKELDPLGFTTDQEEIYNSAFNSISIPPPNSVLKVQVTCLLGINNFCCILDDQKLATEEENLGTLLKFMNQPKNIQEMNKLLIPPSAGQIVIAKYNVDNSWYRAKILESQPENDVYIILFVDYGNKDTVSLSEIRAIEARYLHLPFQAMKCYIFGVDRNPTLPLRDGMNYLNKRITNGNISIEIVSKLPGESIILLVHVFDENGKNIGEDLIANNYAVPKEELLISSESESMPG